MLSFSVIINTFNRAASLRDAIEGVLRLEYDPFEVVVVNGPSTDETATLLQRYAGKLKVASVDERNLSASRNMGIAIAAGDICAFIDDDAYPDPRWLADLAGGYSGAEVAGVGGSTYDHTGHSFQARFLLSNRQGETEHFGPPGPNPSETFSIPFGLKYPSLLGTNSSFRRRYLIDIGGFDEEFEYYLDETDVCARLVNRGYVLKNLESAFVYHKFLPSHLRNQHAVLRSRYAMMKSRAYFALRHRPAGTPLADVVCDIEGFIADQRHKYVWAVEQGLLTENDRLEFEADTRRAPEDALRRFQSGVHLTRESIWFASRQRPFQQHSSKPRSGRLLHVCFLSQEYPPAPVNGIGRFTHEAAMELAARGHHVHVLTRGKGHHRVDLEHGVWVHRLVPTRHDLPEGVTAPQAIWDYSATLRDEILRIHASRPLDLVEGPIWDSEGLATILDGTIPFVLFLCTPLPVALDIHGHWQGQSPDADAHLRALIGLEKFCAEQAHACHAISTAIAEEIEAIHGVRLAAGRSDVVYLGVGEPLPLAAPARAGSEVKALFVGRLERRKGIDLVLECAAPLMARYPRLSLTIVGDDSLIGEAGVTYRALYAERLERYVNEGRLRFMGRVDEAQLQEHYGACDFLVAPSRYESFGLVLIEAMRHGKPVICGNVGGMREIVENGENGLLVGTDGPEDLLEAVSLLTLDADLRQAMADKSRQMYVEKFTRAAMGSRMERFFEAIIDHARQSRTS